MQNQLPGNFPFSHSFHCFSPRLINSLKRPRFCCCLVPCPPPPPVSMTAATGLRWQGGGGCNSCSHIQSFYLSQGLPLQGQERRPQLLGAKHEASLKSARHHPELSSLKAFPGFVGLHSGVCWAFRSLAPWH